MVHTQTFVGYTIKYMSSLGTYTNVCRVIPSNICPRLVHTQTFVGLYHKIYVLAWYIHKRLSGYTIKYMSSLGTYTNVCRVIPSNICHRLVHTQTFVVLYHQIYVLAWYMHKRLSCYTIKYMSSLGTCTNVCRLYHKIYVLAWYIHKRLSGYTIKYMSSLGTYTNVCRVIP